MHGRLWVISPEGDLRRSLEFSLQAEGFMVLSTHNAFGDPAPPPEGIDCVVLDEKAFAAFPGQLHEFCRRAGPVVLLSDRPSEAMRGWVEEVVEKPLHGEDVPRAVRSALGRRANGH